MQFQKGAKLYSSEVQREGGEDILYINYIGAPYVPSISDYPKVMERVVDFLVENQNVSRVILVQQKNYNYDFEETLILLEIAQLYTYLVRQENILSQKKLITNQEQFFTQRYNEIFSFIFWLKQDPIAAYFELKRLIINSKIFLEKADVQYKIDQSNYLNLLEKVFLLLENTKLIQVVLPHLEGYRRGNREIYHKVFKPEVIPNFTFTRLVSDLPADAEIVAQYEIGKDFDVSLVNILRMKDESKLIYHLIPPENILSEDYNMLLNLARGVLIEHQPKAEEFTDTERTRQVFFNISKDLLQDLAQNKGIKLSYSNLNQLATILVRHTIGFGLIEVLLQDKNLQDIVLNAPISRTNIFLRHQTYDECSTNILPSQEDVDSWAAKFRMISGRPLDEANPILDTQLEIGKIRARISIIQQPLSPDGLAYAIRRHRESPWTLPLFVKNKMLNPFAAGLMSFLIDGSRTLLVAGTRSSGKTSLLGSLMLEIIPRYRIIVIEDSLELPVESLRNLKYDILRMKVRSALLKTTTEVSADDGIRTSLRLGDSCLIMGEVRSVEAKALYEAMRIGALANVVAGTIHGASPYGVFDRVVNDLGVPATSFKATDIITICNPIKSPDGLHSWKRVLQIAEVRKHWNKDPIEEKGFVDLMKYNVEKDELEPTDDLINGDSEVIKSIASNVKG
ncbi:MAG: type II/IV secretion system ATPase subunit, partial [Nanoarchaeota archaeon]